MGIFAAAVMAVFAVVFLCRPAWRFRWRTNHFAADCRLAKLRGVRRIGRRTDPYHSLLITV